MTPKLRCLLVDDEPPALDILQTYIEATPMLEIAGACHHAMAAFEFIQQNHVDLIFLDINMPKLTGIDFLRALPSPPKVIFTTAHRDYAVDGFDLGAVDYLLKPYSLDRFLRAVHRAINPEQKHQAVANRESLATENERFLYVRADRKMVKIMVEEIRYIESLKDYVRIFLPEKQVITKQTITALEEMLPEHDFMRIHRSFIVALNKIDSYNLNSVFIGKTELPIGPLYKHELAKKLNTHIRP
ncbi:LytR/AlgR family response regulator transcription factor [Ohtaekwangia sp.]|uniref:LytR/AlgR family response regulator transcription factor n=1 Tax=Ohtaekwangia sp. TaxID=2066019 RepID=UPI002FDDF340